MNERRAGAHVLAVDDDPSVRSLLAAALAGADLRCTTVATGAEAARVLAGQAVDLLVLDLGLPGEEDGLQIAARLRESSSIPILMLTARAHEADRIRGLELGADDYLTKPFSTGELVARVRALLRRAQARPGVVAEIAKARAYRFAGWELNVGLRRLTDPQGRAVGLSNGEFNLLAAFICSTRRPLARDRLLELTRLHEAEVYDSTIDVQILRLRRKIEANPARPRLIVTRRGAGYLLDADVEAIR